MDRFNREQPPGRGRIETKRHPRHRGSQWNIPLGAVGILPTKGRARRPSSDELVSLGILPGFSRGTVNDPWLERSEPASWQCSIGGP